MRILVFGPYFPPAYRGGGPIRTLAALLRTVPPEVESAVITRGTDFGQVSTLEVELDEWVEFGDSKVRYMSDQTVRSWRHSLKAARAFRPDIVYVNSFFDAGMAIFPRMLVRLGVFGRVRLVLAPRGEFGEFALARSRTKKRIYLTVFKFLALGRGIVWHASSPREQDDIRRVVGDDALIVVNENDTELPDVADPVPPRADGPLRAIHVGRLMEIKGLKTLLIALEDVAAPMSLDVVGPFEDPRYAKECVAIAEALPAHITVNFLEHREHSVIRATIAEYDVMLFPTVGENFGHVIAESLSVACPVVCADVTPWTSTLAGGGGVIVESNTPDAWASVVNTYAGHPAAELARRREDAASAYDAWLATKAKAPHLFTRLAEVLGVSSNDGGGFHPRVAVFSPYFPPAFRGGGPIRTLAALVANAPRESETVVITRDTDLRSSRRLPVVSNEWVEHGSARVRYVSARSLRAMWSATRATRAFAPDVIYLNSFFDRQMSIGPQIVTRLRMFGRTQVVLAPRGEFGPGALAIKPLKKRAFLAVYKSLRLDKGVLWHASSAREGTDIRAVMGSAASIVVREDDTELPMTAQQPAPRPVGPLRAVHLARLVPIKGLALLLEALHDVESRLSLDVFGPAEDSAYEQACQRLVAGLPQHIVVNFRGELASDLARSTLANYDVMFMPTSGENFGHVLAESLSVACPVMCPDTTPWTPWLRNGGGVVVEPHTAKAWTQAIEQYARLSADELSHRRTDAAEAFSDWRVQASTAAHLFTMFRAND